MESFNSDTCYDGLMECFLDGFREYLQFPDSTNKTLLRFFMKESLLRPTIWALLKSYLKILVDADCFEPIFTFMFGIFLNRDAFEIDRFSETLESVNVDSITGETKNLKLLYNSFYQRYIDITPDFREGFFPQHILCAAAEIQYKEIYGVDIDIRHTLLGNASSERGQVVDIIISAAINRRQSHYKAILERNIAKNQELEKYDNEYVENGYISHSVRFPICCYEDECQNDFFPVPGVLLPLFQIVEILGVNEFARYLLQTYILKAFAKVNWRSELNPKTRIMETQFIQYAYFIRSLFGKGNNLFKCPEYDPQYYSIKNFKIDILSKSKDVRLFAKISQILDGQSELPVLLEEIIRQGRRLFFKSMPAYLYSFFNIFIPLSFFCVGEPARACKYLADYYSEISPDDRRGMYFQVLVYKCVLETDNVQIASTLLGNCLHDTLRNTRDKEWMLGELRAMVSYVERVKQYLLERNEYTFTTNKSWHDVVFNSNNGYIVDLLSHIKTSCEKSKLPSKTYSFKLLDIIEGLCYHSGIRLSSLGIHPQDDYDKLPNAISKELCAEGNGFLEKYDDYALFYQSSEMINARQQIEEVLRNHIRQLADRSVYQALDRIRELKASIQDEQDEDILKRIEAVSRKIQIDRILGPEGIAAIEQDLFRMQDSFLCRFGLPSEELFEKIQNEGIRREVRSFLTSSEYIYRCIASRSYDDNNYLDFSGALIPLMKALECVLNDYYKKLQMPQEKDNASNLTQGQKKQYYESRNKGRRLSSVPLGPAIYAICNQSYRVEHAIISTYENGCDLFECFGGDRFLDIGKLHAFSGLTVTVAAETEERQDTELLLTFGNDLQENRCILANALHFIRRNYRNKVAHRDPVTKTTFEECKELLLQSENLIWILLYIME